jgi:lipoyl-dependent peroxiredoxin
MTLSPVSSGMAAVRTAQAVWEHDLLHGSGRFKVGSGAIPESPVSWAARTESSGGKTSPEELLAAAHASCFSMAFAAGLGRMGKPPERLNVTATCTFDKVGDGWKVAKMVLDVKGKVPGIDAKAFEEAAQKAGEGCPISQALKGNVPITVTAHLE